MSALYPEIVTTREAKASVITDGLAAGRIVESENGRPITLVTNANKELFYQKMDELLER